MLRPSESSLVATCLVLWCLPLLPTVITAKAILDPNTGIITCNYPEQQSCVMPYSGTNTTYAHSDQ